MRLAFTVRPLTALAVFLLAGCNAWATDDGSFASEVRELGRAMFFDQRLSADGSVSCAGCHQPARAFTDGLATSRGVNGKSGTRNTPSLLDVAKNKMLFWDGRGGDDLEAHALDAMFNPVEHDLADFNHLKRLLEADPRLSASFQKAFAKPATQAAAADVRKAVAAFLGTLASGDSPFDEYYYKNQKQALSPAAERGFELFRGKAQCATCHTLDEKRARFSDQDFHSLGIGREQIERQLPALVARAGNLDGSKLGHTVLSDPDIAALGRFVVTAKPSDIGKFRTPSLRNVALTAPYMHDGSIATLLEAVELEATYRILSRGTPLTLSPDDRSDLLEFLKALTSRGLARPQD